MSDEGGIGRLAALLGALGPDASVLPTPREVAELVWLAGVLPRGTSFTASPVSGTEAAPPAPPPLQPPADDGPTAGTPPPADGEDSPDDGASRLYLPEAGAPGDGPSEDHPASSVRLPTAPALPRRRTLARALRPLKRRVPSTTSSVLDEDATADRLADDARWMPVLLPARERWLDAVLVVDAYGDGSTLWDPIRREFTDVLTELGAFRAIRTYWLRPREDGTPAIATGPHRSLRSPAAVGVPTGRTATFVLTDGVDPAWGGPALRHAVRQWTRNGPTVVLQPLPEHLWGRTALAPEPGRFRSTEPGGANHRLRYTPYTLDAPAPAAGDVPVPVLGIQPAWLEAWARATAGTGEFDAAAVLLRPPDGPVGADLERIPGHDRGPVGFEEFLAQAQPGVFRLAAYLAAAPLNLAVMRLVQTAMLPGSPPSDLAEIVFSGLLHKVPGRSAGDALDHAYEFAPGVRERLLSTLRRDEAAEVVALVSAHVERNARASGTRFTAAVADPQGALRVPAGARHWAEVHDLVQRRRRRAAVPTTGGAAGPAQVSAPVPRPLTGGSTPTATARYRSGEQPAAVRGGGRRFLISIGVARYRDDRLPDLPGIAHDVTRVRSAFEAMGYQAALPHLVADPDARTVLDSVDAWVRDIRPGPDDMVAVHFAGHSALAPDGRALLLFSDSHPELPADARGLAPTTIHRAFGRGLGGLMLLLDTCVPTHALPPAFDPGGPEVWMLAGVTGVDGAGRDTSFARALTDEISDVLDRSAPVPGNLVELAARLEARMGHDAAHHGLPSEQPGLHALAWPAGSLGGTPLPFFPNTGAPEPTGHPQDHTALLWADRSGMFQSTDEWLRQPAEDHRLLYLLGSAETGKTALLTHLHGLTARQGSSPADRPAEHWLPAGMQSVLLRAYLGFATLWDDLAAVLGLPAGSHGDHLAHLTTTAPPVLVLLDGLDEAAPDEAGRIAAEVVRPLAAIPSVRVIISTRRASDIEPGPGVTVLTSEADPAARCDLALRLGTLALERSNPAAAERHFREALAVSEQARHPAGIADSHHHLGLIAREAGDDDGAEEHHRTALAGYTELNDAAGAATSERHLEAIEAVRLMERSLAGSPEQIDYLVDLSNVVHNTSVGGPERVSLRRFGLVVEALARLTGDPHPAVHLVADRSLMRLAGPEDARVLRRWADRGLMEVVARADVRILELAEVLHVQVISSDRFLDLRREHPWVQGDTGRFLSPARGPGGTVRLVTPDMGVHVARHDRFDAETATSRRQLHDAANRLWTCPAQGCRLYDGRNGRWPLPRMRDGVPTCEVHDTPLVDAGPRPVTAQLKTMVDGVCVHRFTVEEGTTPVGRGPHSGVTLPFTVKSPEFASISREHVVLVLTGGTLTVRDVSTNGTRMRTVPAPGQVDGWERLPPEQDRPFGPGDEVELARGVTLVRSGRLLPAELAAARQTDEVVLPGSSEEHPPLSAE
ncbi:SAV_2336 N-terminal domain-related protein [Kitasatospora sp. KL5]|uniref:SAV_2336 N-terminal domain-related protein n=1 Tax=Kitasatospora sp. KL5 TaxID=3425125 RepID=UPI003D6FE314